jgi:hypothetical protein
MAATRDPRVEPRLIASIHRESRESDHLVVRLVSIVTSAGEVPGNTACSCCWIPIKSPLPSHPIPKRPLLVMKGSRFESGRVGFEEGLLPGGRSGLVPSVVAAKEGLVGELMGSPTEMQGGGFEPPKAEPAGLQPAPFGHSGTPARAGNCTPAEEAVCAMRARARSARDPSRPASRPDCGLATWRGRARGQRLAGAMWARSHPPGPLPRRSSP